MTNGQIFLLMWVVCAVLNMVYIIKSEEGTRTLNSEAAPIIIIFAIPLSPFFSFFGVIMILNELSSNLKEQEKEEKKKKKTTNKS